MHFEVSVVQLTTLEHFYYFVFLIDNQLLNFCLLRWYRTSNYQDHLSYMCRRMRLVALEMLNMIPWVLCFQLFLRYQFLFGVSIIQGLLDAKSLDYFIMNYFPRYHIPIVSPLEIVLFDIHFEAIFVKRLDFLMLRSFVIL